MRLRCILNYVWWVGGSFHVAWAKADVGTPIVGGVGDDHAGLLVLGPKGILPTSNGTDVGFRVLEYNRIGHKSTRRRPCIKHRANHLDRQGNDFTTRVQTLWDLLGCPHKPNEKLMCVEQLLFQRLLVPHKVHDMFQFPSSPISSSKWLSHFYSGWPSVLYVKS